MQIAPSPVVVRLAAVNRFLAEDFLGGPKVLKMAWVINFQKGGTLFYIAMLMAVFHNTSPAAWTILALQGTYGLCWLLKDTLFPDATWQKRITFGGAFLTFTLVLGMYWLIPFLAISPILGVNRPQPSLAFLALCVGIHTLGLAIMLASDAQKHFTLRIKRGLITDGMFRFVRHPNYLGEMMLYGAYALIVQSWIPWVILGAIWLQVFTVNMLQIEASLARYPGWAAYRARTGFLLPKFRLSHAPTTGETPVTTPIR